MWYNYIIIFFGVTDNEQVDAGYADEDADRNSRG